MIRILVLLFFFCLISCAEENTTPKKLTSFIPENAGIVIKTEHPDLFFDRLKNHALLKNNKDFPLFKKLEEELWFFDHFVHQKPGILILVTPNNQLHHLFLSREPIKISSLDSIPNKKVVNITLDNHEIKEYTLQGKTSYTSSVSGVFLASDSKKILLKSLNDRNGKNEIPLDFKKAWNAASPNLPTVFINHNQLDSLFGTLFPGFDRTFIKKFSNWSALDLEIAAKSIRLNGITTATSDSANTKLVNVFKGVNPEENKFAEIVPESSTGFFAFGYEFFSKLKNNLNAINNQKSTANHPEALALLKNSAEAGIGYLGENSFFALRSINPEAAIREFAPEKKPALTFRGIEIFKNPHPKAFRALLHPLIEIENLNYFLFLNQFVLFAETPAILQEIVENVQNKATFSNNEAYTAAMKNLSTQASLLLVAKNRDFKKVLAQKVPNEFKTATSNFNFENFPFAVLQIIYSNDFAHVHALLQQTDHGNGTASVAQTAQATLGAPLTAPPVFFKNHRTHGLDIAVQDSDNVLYLISNQGEAFWKKKLDYHILGEIQQVDLYQNGNIQLAFATPHALHVIDRDGNTVPPFPIEFNDEITLPVAIFDYDGDRDYRFVIVQDEQVFMYNNKGERVRGFTFTKAEAKITQIPKHIRIGNKDYILIADAKGNLNILSRTGKIRVPVNEKLEFSENEWYENQKHFVSTNLEGNLIKIDENGTISKKETALSSPHYISATEQVFVSLSENKLTINDQELSLDYGIYTPPQTFEIGNKTYIGITDLQSQRVYLFNEKGQLLPGFPVYGNSSIALGNDAQDSTLELAVQGEENSIIWYEID